MPGFFPSCYCTIERDPHRPEAEWAYHRGLIFFRLNRGGWWVANKSTRWFWKFEETPERVAVWVALMLNPTKP